METETESYMTSHIANLLQQLTSDDLLELVDIGKCQATRDVSRRPAVWLFDAAESEAARRNMRSEPVTPVPFSGMGRAELGAANMLMTTLATSESSEGLARLFRTLANYCAGEVFDVLRRGDSA